MGIFCITNNYISQFIWGIRDTASINWYFLSIWGIISDSNTKLKASEILYAGIISIPLGFTTVWVNNKRWVYSFLVKYGISKKYGDDSVYLKTVEYLSDCYVNVYLKEEKLTAQGKIYLYHESEQIHELAMIETKVYSETGDHLFDSDLIYFSGKLDNFIISYLGEEK